MHKTLLAALTAAGLVATFAPQTSADNHGDKAKTIKGEGLCAKCELGETDSCTNAIRTTEDGKKVVYYLAPNQVSKDFHSNVCKKTVPVYAKGKVETVDGKKQLTAEKIDVQKEKTLTGIGTCAKCGLKETKSCQNAVKVKESGKTLVYFLDHNKVSKDFHSNVCQKEVEVIAKGTVAEVDGRLEFTPKEIKVK